MAPHLIMAHTAICPSIRNVVVWNRTPEKAEDVIKDLANLNPSSGLNPGGHN